MTDVDFIQSNMCLRLRNCHSQSEHVHGKIGVVLENFCWGHERSVGLVDGANNNNQLDTMRLPETLVWAALFIHEVRHAEYISSEQISKRFPSR